MRSGRANSAACRLNARKPKSASAAQTRRAFVFVGSTKIVEVLRRTGPTVSGQGVRAHDEEASAVRRQQGDELSPFGG